MRGKSDRYEPCKTHFLKDVGRHKMTVMLNDGLYRHLRFARPGSSNFHFNIVTWPGYLAITGDMEAFTFSRTPDMFEFFRGVSINPMYWSEKIVATSRHGGHRKFSPNLFKREIREDFKQWKFKNPAERKEAWDAILFDIYEPEENDGNHAIHEVMDYCCPVTRNRFVDFWDHTFEDYTYHFIWACRAIRWSIEQFDKVQVLEWQHDRSPNPIFGADDPSAACG
jgi:hypothetical protein